MFFVRCINHVLHTLGTSDKLNMLDASEQTIRSG